MSVGWHFRVNAFLNKVETFYGGRDISETVAVNSLFESFKIFMSNAGFSTLVHSIYDRGGGYFSNFGVGMCCWDPGTLNLYQKEFS